MTRRFLTPLASVGLALALVAPVGPAQASPAGDRIIEVPMSRAPRDGHPDIAWFDGKRQVIHDGARAVTVTPPLPGRVENVSVAGSGFLVIAGSYDLFRVDADGSHVALGVTAKSLAVENTGTRVAVRTVDVPTSPWQPSNDWYIDVVRLADGVREARIPSYRPELFDFTDGVVTFGAPVPGGDSTDVRVVSTWDSRGQVVTVLGKRLRNPVAVDLRHGLVTHQADPGKDMLTVSSLARGGPSWTVPGLWSYGASPDGRLVAIFYGFEDRNGFFHDRLTIRDARTGAPVRTFDADVFGPVTWESNKRLIAMVENDAHISTYGLIRLHLSGRAERVSRAAGPGHVDQVLVNSVTLP